MARKINQALRRGAKQINARRKMIEGREAMARRCCAAALANTPPEVRVIKVRRSLTGRAYSDGTLAAPRPMTRRALYIFLHECAHFVLGHLGNKGRRQPRHVSEMEAEQWAHKQMRAAGLAVPRSMTKQARRYVARLGGLPAKSWRDDEARSEYHARH